VASKSSKRELLKDSRLAGGPAFIVTTKKGPKALATVNAFCYAGRSQGEPQHGIPR
jgi:hypothetical protein